MTNLYCPDPTITCVNCPAFNRCAIVSMEPSASELMISQPYADLQTDYPITADDYPHQETDAWVAGSYRTATFDDDIPF